ncbi:MAG TPA: hypothetical protein VK564_01920, partial [Thermodesulfobacteriota bacterium]|nr:hypothetical protein [Thermodesulfobacteriota bacterium]
MGENIPAGRDRPPLSSDDMAAWVLSGAALFFVLKLHLLPVLLSGLLVYELVQLIAPGLRLTRLVNRRARLAAVALLAIVIAALIGMIIWGLMIIFMQDSGNLPTFFKKLTEIIENSKDKFPAWLNSYLPENLETVKEGLVNWLREHTKEVQGAGMEAGRATAHVLAGLVLGALISLRDAVPIHKYRPLARSLVDQAARLSGAFRSVVFAQVRIAALNALFAGIYLGLLLPLLGIHLPLV